MPPNVPTLLKATKVLLLGKNGLPSPPPANPASPSSERALTVSKRIYDRFHNVAQGLAREAEIGPHLHAEAMAALHRMQELDSSLKKLVDEAYGYAIFPSAARAALVLGVTYGKGEVFEQGQVIGYAGIIQVTIGVQLGGGTAHVLVLLKDKAALECLQSGKLDFAANASLGAVKTGVTAIKRPYGLRIFMYPEGGAILEAAIGGQKIKFKAAALGRMRSAA